MTHSELFVELWSETQKVRCVPLCTTSIGANDDGLTPVGNLGLDMSNHGSLTEQVIDWDIEEALYLACVKIEGDEVVASGRDEHISNEFGGDGCSALVLLVLSGIRVARNDGGDSSSRGGSAGGDEDEEFHEVVVDVEAS